MSMSKFKQIYDPVLRQNIYFLKSTFGKFIKEMKKYDADYELDEVKSRDGRAEVIEVDGCIIPFIWVQDDTCDDVIIHEVVHAVQFILDERGIDDDEVFAYYVQWIYREIFGAKK